MLLHSNNLIFKHFILHKAWQHRICNDMLNRQDLIDVAKRVPLLYNNISNIRKVFKKNNELKNLSFENFTFKSLISQILLDYL